MFDFTPAIRISGVTPTLHSVIRYCERFLNTKITEKEIHQNSFGKYTKNFDVIAKAYDDIHYYLNNPIDANDEGIRLVVRGREVVTVIKVFK